MSDRVIVFGSNPGRIVADVKIDIQRPRERTSSQFLHLVDHLYGQFTDADVRAIHPTDPLPEGARLHHVPPGLINGLVELLATKAYGGHADLPVVAQELHMGVGELFPVAETLEHLGLAVLEEGDLHLTPGGAEYAAASGDARKQLFARRIQERVGLIRYIVRGVKDSAGERLPAERVEAMLRQHQAPREAEETLLAAVVWGRYAELFSYDDRQRQFTFEDL